MKQKRVTFKVAKAIKEAQYSQNYSFNISVYDKDGKEIVIGDANIPLNCDAIIAPTYLDVWQWLWKEKDIRLVPVDTTVSGKYIGVVAVRIGLHIFRGETPEEAIASAINYLVDNDLIK